MADTAPPGFFAQFKEWLSFVDNVWGVGGALVVILGLMYRRLKSERALASERLKGLSGELAALGSTMERIEAQNAELAAINERLRSRDFSDVLDVARLEQRQAKHKVAAEKLYACFMENAEALSGTASELARIHLDAFYAASSIGQLSEAHRFASLAMLACPDDISAKQLHAEIALAIAGSPTAQVHKSKDDLWDEALQLFETSNNSNAGQTFVALQLVGTKLRSEGRYELAGAALRAAARIAESEFGLHSKQTLIAMNNVATNYNDRGLPASAKPLLIELARRHQEVAGHVDESTYQCQIGAAACDRKLIGEEHVLPMFQSLVKEGMERFGPDNRWVLKAQNSLAVCLVQVGRLNEAEKVYRETAEREIRLFGIDHDNPLSTQANLARLLWRTRREQEAIAILRDIARRRVALQGEQHPAARSAIAELRNWEREVDASPPRT